MVEYILKFHKKNIKSQISLLIKELETLFEIDNVKVLKSDKVFFSELSSIVSKDDFDKINNLYYTLYLNREGCSFYEKYLDKNKFEDKKYRFADLFAGCGGLSVGLEQAGFNASFVNEIDSSFCESYYFNHNLGLENYFVGDINTLVNDLGPFEKSIKDLDLVCGGPPCQGFSMANRQRIIDDPRNNLYKSYLFFLSKTRPKFFLMENVKGMAQKIDEIISDFNTYLGDEYNIDFSILNAKDFGVPQNRERFFIIGNRIEVDSKKIFTDIKKGKKHNFVLKDALENLPQLLAKSQKNKKNIDSEESGLTIKNYAYPKSGFNQFINEDREIKYLFNHKNRFNNERDIEIFRRLPQGANSLHESIKDIMPYSSRNHMFKDKYYKLNENEVSKTITSHMKFDCNMYIHPNQARGLSPREAARIQTFPDDYFLRGSQNNWYAQVGNAVPVKLAKIIGENIIKYL